MEEVTKELLATVKRLNKELDERTIFEGKLIEAISKKDELINELEERLSKYEQKEVREEVKQELKAEKIISDSLNGTPMLKVDQ